MTSQTASSVALPSGVEVFRAGSYISSTGLPVTLTADDLADIAAQYNADTHESPVTVGHPKDDQPAYGWVKSLKSVGGALVMDYSQVEPQFAELVRSGRFKKRSAAFYTPNHPHNPTPGHWHLRHVAFLGAAPPVVKGLKDVAQFSEEDSSLEGCVCFTEPIKPIEPVKSKKDISMPDPIPTPATPAPSTDAQAQAQIAQLQQQITALQQQVAEITKERDAALAAQKAAEDKLSTQAKAEEVKQEQAIAQFAEGLVKAGKVLPKDKAMHVEIMNNLAKADKQQLVEFSEGNVKRTESRLDAYKKQLAGKDAVVQFGEFAAAALGQESSGQPLTDEQIDKKVQEYMAAHPDVDYAQALSAVTQGL